MHRLSQSCLQLRQTQALVIQKHGYSVEVLGQDLQRRNEQSAQLSGQMIEECGKTIQHKAQESLMCINLLLQTSGMPDFHSKLLDKQAIEAQAEARRLYTQALVFYLQVVRESLRSIEQHLQVTINNRLADSDSE